MTTRERLLDLAETSICTHGYGGFSYADLGASAGISKASIHHHFARKSDLGIAVLDRYADRLAVRLDEIRKSSRSGAQQVLAVIQLYREAMGDGSQVSLCAALGLDHARLSGEMQAMLARANAMVAAWLERALLEGRKDRSIAVSGDPREEALAVQAQLYGAQLLARSAGERHLFDCAIEPLSLRAGGH